MAEKNAIVPMLERLEQFAEDEIGWDASPTLFAFSGSIDDAHVAAIVVLAGGHPADMMVNAEPLVMQVKAGLKDKPFLGIALTNEGWTYSQEIIDGLAEQAKEWVDRNIDSKPPEMSLAEARAHIVEQMSQRLWQMMPPSQTPDRREYRSTTALLRDGQFWMVTRHRGSEPEVVNMSSVGSFLDGRIPDAMKVLMQAVLDEDA